MSGLGRTVVFIPTYNERENVAPLHAQIRALGLDLDIVFLDDSSPDGTGQILDELAQQDPRTKVIHRAGKLGIGSAHQDGIAYAYRHGYTVLLTMDADFTHQPSDLAAMLALADQADIVVGSRHRRADSLAGWNPVRLAITKIAHVLVCVFLGMPEDASGALRLYRLDRLEPQLFKQVRARGYSFFFESLFVLKYNRATIAELPIKLPPRTYGHSKMPRFEVGRALGVLGGLVWRRVFMPGSLYVMGAIKHSTPPQQIKEEWDQYWTQQSSKVGWLYSTIATIYRNLVIRSNLERALRREFAPGAKLLHAGCGSGMVDARLHRHFNIWALDISPEALALYRTHNPDAQKTVLGNLLQLEIGQETFDGVYNLGVMEHFSRPDITTILTQLRKVLKPDGKCVLFWPHYRATSVMTLGLAHWVLKRVFKWRGALHPPEISLINQAAAADICTAAGFTLISYEFGLRDGFVQAIIVARPSAAAAPPGTA